MLSHSRLLKLLKYDPITGVFIWRSNCKTAGYLQRGYIVITIDRKPYRRNRLAWLYMTGAFPKDYVDHKNRKLSDDCWDNLRLANHAQNRANSFSRNKSGFKGVFPHRRRWKAQIRYNKKLLYIGIYLTPEEANRAYFNKAKELFGEFACAG